MLRVSDMALWEAFLAIAKLGSFAQAARQLRVSPPQLSKRVNKLEELLGMRCFQRSTRSVSLTAEGRAILPVVTTLLNDLENLEAQFEDVDELSGSIRVTCVPAVAERFVFPRLQTFLDQHPAIKIELDLSERFANLIEENIDIAIRIQKPADTSLVYRKITANQLVLCASPSYLKRCGEPLRKPEDLHRHPFLHMAIHDKVRFAKSGQALGDFRGARRIVCENGMTLRNLAVQGYGVLARSLWDLEDLLASGKLVRVLERHPLETFGDLYAVIPSRRYLAPRVRRFLDFLVAEPSYSA